MGIFRSGPYRSNVEQWLGATPNALQTGRPDVYIGAIASALTFPAKIRTLTDIAVTYDANVSGTDPFSSQQASGVTDVSKSIILPRGVTDDRTSNMSNTAELGTVSWVWEWNGTNVRARHTTGVGRSIVTRAYTLKATVVEFY